MKVGDKVRVKALAMTAHTDKVGIVCAIRPHAAYSVEVAGLNDGCVAVFQPHELELVSEPS